MIKYFDTLGTVETYEVNGVIVARTAAGDVTGKEIPESEHAKMVKDVVEKREKAEAKIREDREAAGREAFGIRDAGLQKFADEALALGFSIEAIGAVTGKTAKQKGKS